MSAYSFPLDRPAPLTVKQKLGVTPFLTAYRDEFGTRARREVKGASSRDQG